MTDNGTIDDKSFNQGTWEGLTKFAKENKKSYKYYQPASDAKDDLLASISLAIEGGAAVVVCPGFNFETAIYEAQVTYPDTKFILLDGQPNDGDYTNGPTYRTDSNVMCILYAEQQAGFLAGYAAVKDGYTKLGFMGGMSVPAVVRFGYGFVQGADYAAKELNIQSVEMNYTYTGQFAATPEAQTTASGWYSAGTEVIFGCGGALGDSVMAAAATAGKYAIGVDVDQSYQSETVITSAMKNVSISVYDALTAFYGGSFSGGQTVTVNVTTNGVGLPMSTSKFNTFSQADYDAIYAKIASGEITIKTDADASDAASLGASNVAVTLVG